MKKLIKSESGAATIIEAVLIFPIVFVCVMFMVVSGFTYVQKAVLQSTADRLSQYIARCIAYPGYEDIIDPFYAPAKDTDLLTRVNTAMARSEPYRYVAGLFGLNSQVKFSADDAENAMIDEGYLKSVSFLKPSGTFDSNPPELANMTPAEGEGYVCAISANTTNITVYLGQEFAFSKFFRLIGIYNKEMIIFGKSTSNVTDVPETVRIVDFTFDTVEDIVSSIEGGDKVIEQVTSVINKISGNE